LCPSGPGGPLADLRVRRYVAQPFPCGCRGGGLGHGGGLLPEVAGWIGLGVVDLGIPQLATMWFRWMVEEKTRGGGVGGCAELRHPRRYCHGGCQGARMIRLGRRVVAATALMAKQAALRGGGMDPFGCDAGQQVRRRSPSSSPLLPNGGVGVTGSLE
jgi:hypothetical protein